tara:strand:+ start:21 stop:401 length:381 start_codon:yes stop_codon:yes gene_type:complete
MENEIKYSKDFLCTYQLIEDLEEADLLYKIQFLQAFKIDNLKLINDEEIFSQINFTTSQLYEKYRNNKHIKLLMNAFRCENIKEEFLFAQLFSFDTFFIIHKIISVKDIPDKEVEVLIEKCKPNKI